MRPMQPVWEDHIRSLGHRERHAIENFTVRSTGASTVPCREEELKRGLPVGLTDSRDVLVRPATPRFCPIADLHSDD